MLVVNKFISPSNTADGRIVAHLTSADGVSEISLTRKAATQAVLSLLWAIGNLPKQQEDIGKHPIQVTGSLVIGIVGGRRPVAQVSMNGIEVVLDLSKQGWADLQEQFSAARQQLT